MNRELVNEKLQKVIEELYFAGDIVDMSQSQLMEYRVIISEAKNNIKDPLLKTVLAMIMEMMDFAEVGLVTASDVIERCRDTLNEVIDEVNKKEMSQ